MQKLMMSMFKTSIVTFVSAVFLIVPLSSNALVDKDASFVLNGYEIQSFDSDIRITEKSEIFVKESIQVNFNSDFFKHGIFRDIPVVYRVGEFGQKMRIDLKVDSVLLDGDPVPYSVSRYSNQKEIKIGDSDKYIEGEHVYTVSYRVKRAMLFFNDRDELYFNVTGDIWDVPIMNSSALVHIPENLDVNAICYTGEFGSKDQNCGIAHGAGVVSFAAEDFLTIGVQFPLGTFIRPNIFTKMYWVLESNWPVAIPWLFIIFIVYYWYKRGRDPHMRTVVAEFEPPEDLWAVYAYAILHGKTTSQQLTAMVIQLAAKGYLTIEQKQSEKKGLFKTETITTTFRKKREGDGLDRLHKKLFNKIFKKGRQSATLVQLGEEDLGLVFISMRKNIQKKMVKDGWYTKDSFRNRTLITAVGTLVIFFGYIPSTWVGGYIMLISTILAGVVIMAFGFFMPKRTMAGTELARKVKGFKLFMHTAERYRSEWQEKEMIFADYLPYAIAFNQVQQWNDAMKDTFTKYPDWYQSDLPISSGMVFANSLTALGSSLRSTGSTSSSISSGGFSSGGGFSGGGFGGGGGGSW